MAKIRLISILLSFSLLFSLCACSGNKTANTDSQGDVVAETYLDEAKKSVENQDYDSAIAILKKGMEMSDSKALSEYLSEVVSMQAKSIAQNNSDDPAKDDEEKNKQEEIDAGEYLDNYLLTWATAGIDYDTPGMILNFVYSYGEVYINCTKFKGAPSHESDQLIAKITEPVIDDSLSIGFEDGYENKGTLILVFKGGSIEFKVSDVSTVKNADGGYGKKCSYTLIENNNAWNDVAYKSTEKNQEYEQSYDTSKASGILAYYGLTEQEFREQCQPLDMYDWEDHSLNAGDLMNYPSQYSGQFFYFSYYYMDACHLNYMSVDEKGIIDNCTAYVWYSDSRSTRNILIYDLRDDIYSPTISSGDAIYPYMIFEGVRTINGSDYLSFYLISVDK